MSLSRRPARPARARRRSEPPRVRARLDFAARLRGAEPRVLRRLRQHSTLADLVRAVGATIEPEAIAMAMLERAGRWMAAAPCAVVSSDRAGRASALAQQAFDARQEAGVLAIGQWVMSHGAVFSSADLAQDGRIAGDATGSTLALPLVSRGTPIGALVALDPSPSTRGPRLARTTEAALAVVLDAAASALDMALMLGRAEALSVTDDLTDLYNSRYLNQVLRRETKRAARSGRPLSLLFVDLDGFKTINDTHGHWYGSRALVEAGALIRSGARETDIVARFGGDEFALVLPDTGAAGAQSVAERVRERIAKHVFLTADGLAISLTASVGIATLPDVAQSADGLVQAADAAMYAVKARGKNGIQAAAVSADK